MTIFVRLRPVSRGAAEDAEKTCRVSASSAAPRELSYLWMGDTMRVLIVDDEPAARRRLALMLE
ncbi:MAG TPA: hypothetical protein VFY65_14930, partial [Longimicrobium sp.]|nr:hypothetical protein [Longimicrobium sp.]